VKANRDGFSIVVTNHGYDRYIFDIVCALKSQAAGNIQLILASDREIDDDVKSILTSEEGLDILFVIIPKSGQVEKILSVQDKIYYNYVALLDADDFYSNSHLSEVKKLFQGDPELDVLVTSHTLVDESGNEIVGDENLRPFFTKPGVQIETCSVVSGLKGTRVQPTSCYVFSREALGKIFRHIPDGSKWEASADDILITVAKLSHMKIMYSGKPTVSYRLHGANLSTKPTSLFNQQRRLFNRDVFVSETLRSLGVSDRTAVDLITRGIPMSIRDLVHSLEMIVHYSSNSFSVIYNSGKLIYRYLRSLLYGRLQESKFLA